MTQLLINLSCKFCLETNKKTNCLQQKSQLLKNTYFEVKN